MSHATIHATLAARDVLTIPSPPWRSRIVSTPGRLRFRERTDYWQKYHSQSWKTDRDRRRLVYRAMAGETNDRPSTLRQNTSGRSCAGTEEKERSEERRVGKECR